MHDTPQFHRIATTVPSAIIARTKVPSSASLGLVPAGGPVGGGALGVGYGGQENQNQNQDQKQGVAGYGGGVSGSASASASGSGMGIGMGIGMGMGIQKPRPALKPHEIELLKGLAARSENMGGGQFGRRGGYGN